MDALLFGGVHASFYSLSLLRHDLTLSMGEPDNAAAKLRSEQTVTPLHEQSPATYFLRLNNLETFVELVGARPLHLLSQTVLSLKHPTGVFVAFANAKALSEQGSRQLSAFVCIH